jgi:glycogen operon protein
VWLDADASTMTPSDWDTALGRSVGVFLNGDGIHGRDTQGRRITDVNFLLYFNADEDEVGFRVPSDEYAPAWDVMIDTGGEGADSDVVKADQILMIAAKSLVVLRAHSAPETEPDHSVAASLAALTQTSTPETASLTAPAVTSAPADSVPNDSAPEVEPGASQGDGAAEGAASDGGDPPAGKSKPARKRRSSKKADS